MQNHLWVRLVTGGLSLSVCLTAQAQDLEPIELGRVLITPQRMVPGTALREADFPGNATVITADDIRAAGVSTVQEALNRVEGVSVVDTHGFGLSSDSTVNLRGVVNSSRTNALVVVDGVPQNRITGDEVHWQSIPVEQIERIEILRGGGGTLYGEGALAGVINILTKKSSPQSVSGENGIEFGGFGQQKYWTAVRGSERPVSYGFSATRRFVDGYRNNTNSRGTTITTHTGLEFAERWKVETNVLHSEDTTAFSGGITPEMTEQDRRHTGSFPGLFDDETDQVSLDLTGDLGHGVTLGLNSYWRHRLSESVGTHFATQTPSKGVGMRFGHTATGAVAAHTVIGGADFSDDKATTGTRGAAAPDRMSESNRTAFGLYLEETVRFWDRVTLVAGYRFDKSRFHEDITFPDFNGTLRFEGHSPRVGVTYHWGAFQDLFASWARVFKAPNIDDLSAVDALFRSNVDLEPQIANHYEMGLRVRPHGWWPLTAEATYFRMRMDDEILYDTFNFTNNNFDTVRDGVELAVSGAWWDGRASAYANYAFVKARFHEGLYTGYRLPLTPEHHLKMGGAVKLHPRLTVGLDWELVNRQFRINDFLNQLPADNYGVARLTLRYTHKHFLTYLNLENVTNEEYTTFQSSDGTTISTGEHPAPPFWVLGGVVVRF